MSARVDSKLAELDRRGPQPLEGARQALSGPARSRVRSRESAQHSGREPCGAGQEVGELTWRQRIEPHQRPARHDETQGGGRGASHLR